MLTCGGLSLYNMIQFLLRFIILKVMSSIWTSNWNKIHPFTHTYDGGHHFEAEQWVVLEEFDERKRDQWKILHLSKDGGPVSQGRQNPEEVGNTFRWNPVKSKKTSYWNESATSAAPGAVSGSWWGISAEACCTLDAHLCRSNCCTPRDSLAGAAVNATKTSWYTDAHIGVMLIYTSLK